MCFESSGLLLYAVLPLTPESRSKLVATAVLCLSRFDLSNPLSILSAAL